MLTSISKIFTLQGEIFRINFCEKLEPHAEICLRDYRNYLFHVNKFLIMNFILIGFVLIFVWISEQRLLPCKRDGGCSLRGAKLDFK
jgi:hypothetical protein